MRFIEIILVGCLIAVVVLPMSCDSGSRTLVSTDSDTADCVQMVEKMCEKALACNKGECNLFNPDGYYDKTASCDLNTCTNWWGQYCDQGALDMSFGSCSDALASARCTTDQDGDQGLMLPGPCEKVVGS